jgi:hypothetical protein
MYFGVFLRYRADIHSFRNTATYAVLDVPEQQQSRMFSPQKSPRNRSAKWGDENLRKQQVSWRFLTLACRFTYLCVKEPDRGGRASVDPILWQGGRLSRDTRLGQLARGRRGRHARQSLDERVEPIRCGREGRAEGAIDCLGACDGSGLALGSEREQIGVWISGHSSAGRGSGVFDMGLSLAFRKRYCYRVANTPDLITISLQGNQMTPAQCRMARVALELGVRGLADVAKVSTNTVTRFERGEELRVRTVDAIRTALEYTGVEFIAENGGGAGVRLRKGAK